MKDVVGLGCETTHELRMKEWNTGRFPRAPNGLYLDLRRGHGYYPITRACFVRSNLRVFRRHGQHVRIRRTCD